MGNINDAVQCAARMGKTKDFTLREYPEKKNFFERLLNDYKNDVKTSVIKEEIGEEQYSILKKLQSLRNMIAIPQARLPFDISIQ
jgi:protease-4